MSARAILVALVAAAGCRAASPSATTTPPTTPSPAPAGSVVAHESFTLASRALGELRRINIYRSPGHDGAAGALVLYMPDGGLQEDFPHVTSALDAAVRAGEVQPVVVVGIENTERRRDMTGPTEVAKDREIAPRVGGSAEFRAFIRDELMPEVRRRVPGGGRTAIVGESLAGLFVVETFFAEPGLFDVHIALSPSLWWNDQGLVRGAGERLRADPGRTGTLYIASAGDDDVDGAIAGFAAVLRADAPAGLRWYFEPRPDLAHSTIYRAAAPGVFKRLFPAGVTASPR